MKDCLLVRQIIATNVCVCVSVCVCVYIFWLRFGKTVLKMVLTRST